LSKQYTLEDELPLPFIFVNVIVKFSEMLLQGKISSSDSQLSTMIFNDVSGLSKKREQPYITRPQQFFV
jgi:hypothetical protein